MEGLSFAYPSWYVVFCLLAGLAYAMVLYYRDATFRERLPWLHRALGLLRFVVVSLLAMLLLSPLLRSMQTETRKPVVVMAQDVSESVALALPDSAAYRERWKRLQERLSADYDVQQITFGQEVNPDGELSFSDRKTNITQALQHVYDLYGNQNLGAVILATDGIYNQGANPVYADVKLNAPVYTVALGDTTRKRDLSLARVFHNRVVYLGDQFSIQVDVAALNAAGAATTLTVSRVEGQGSQVLRQESISIDKGDFFTTREILLNADKSGVQRYRLSLSPINGESNKANNVRDIFIDVLDAREKILILAHAPHPDVSALKQSLTTGRNNEVDIAYAENFNQDVKDYDLVILHQLPSARHDLAAVFNAIRQQNKPVWYIVGDQNNFPRFNQVQNLVKISGSNQSNNEVQARIAPDFSLFTLGDNLSRWTPTLPPLVAPFGDFMPGGNVSVFMYQRIGKVDTRFPLLLFGEQQGARSAVLCATGLWQWRLFDFLDSENHNRFDKLVGKVTQYLSVKDDKRRFRVLLPKNIFDETESITFDAELYNESYELVNTPDARLVVTDAEGKEYSFTFNRAGRAYTLSAGVFPVGNYRFRASVNTGTETLNFQGQFSVQPIQLEQYATTADHALLGLLSQRYGGEKISPADLDRLPEQLAGISTLKPVIYSTLTTRSVINLKWIFALFMLLLSAEWFARRYFGAY